MAFLSCTYFIESIGPKIKVKFSDQVVRTRNMFVVRTLYLFFFTVCVSSLLTFGKRLTMITVVVILETNFFSLVELSKLIERTLFEGKLDNKKKKVSLEQVLCTNNCVPMTFQKLYFFRQNTVTFLKNFLLID